MEAWAPPPSSLRPCRLSSPPQIAMEFVRKAIISSLLFLSLLYKSALLRRSVFHSPHFFVWRGRRRPITVAGRTVMENNLLEEVFAYANASPQHQERKPRPQQEQALRCPRCDSTNTKFCYYNNYSLSQPRYFCKSCRRYWTKGGTLRNVPVGGGCRKNKRSSFSTRKLEDQALLQNLIPPNPNSFALPQAQGFSQSLDPFNGFCYGFESQALLPWEMVTGVTATIKQEPLHGNGEFWHGLVNGFLI